MSDIFISYAREDLEVVNKLADALERRGWSVWWDRTIPTGARFGQVIEQALKASRCVLVVWSEHSVDSNWVRAEAAEGLQRGVLIPLRIDEASIPLVYRQFQTEDLSHWDGSEESSGFQRLVRDITALINPSRFGTKIAHTPSLEEKPPPGRRPGKLFDRPYRVALFSFLILAGITLSVIYYRQIGEARSALPAKLIQQTSVTLEQVIAPGEDKSNLYWPHLLDSGKRRYILERAVLLALEANRLSPSAETEQALRAGLVLLTRPIVELEGSRVVFSPDREYLATYGSFRNDEATIVWEAKTGKQLQRFPDDKPVRAAAFSPDGRSLATASADPSVRLWHVVSGREVLRLPHEEHVNDIAFSPDGLHLATACRDGQVRVWRIPDGEQVTSLVHQASVREVKFSASGRHIGTLEDANAVLVWDANTGRQLSRLLQDAYFGTFAFSPDEHLVATTGSRYARLWDLGGREVAQFKHRRRDVNDVAFSPDGQYLATGDSLSARIWEISSGRETMHFGHGDTVMAVAFSPDGNYLATGSQDQTARIWQLGSGEEIARMEHRDNVTNVHFSPDGALFASASQDGVVKIWRPFPEDLRAEACARLTRNLTPDEWREYFGDKPYFGDEAYRKTCPNLQ